MTALAPVWCARPIMSDMLAGGTDEVKMTLPESDTPVFLAHE